MFARSIFTFLGLVLFQGVLVAQATNKPRVNPEKERWETVLKKAMDQTQADPNSVPAWMNMALARDRLGQYKESEAAFTKALGLQPTLHEAMDRRGSARFFQGDIAGSIQDFDRYLLAKPNEKPGHWRRGIALYYAASSRATKRLIATMLKTPSGISSVWPQRTVFPMPGRKSCPSGKIAGCHLWRSILCSRTKPRRRM